MSMCKTTLAPGQLLRSVHMEKSYLGKAGYPRCCTTGNPPLEVAPGQRKTHVNSYRCHISTLYNVSAVPWGVFSTVGDIMSTVREYHEHRGGVQYRGGIS